ncbi:DUF4174 domain-containing protein [Catalinimonas alkaloidigena]|nr:DUF4174 domain-containing protein [Catalinimonas alkaloidigena]
MALQGPGAAGQPAPHQPSNAGDVLAPYRWSNRLLLIFSEDTNITDYQRQVSILQSDQMGMADRDLVFFRIFPDEGYTPDNDALTPAQVTALRERFDVGTGFTVILIGKDGGEKRTERKPLTLDQLYGTIDAMPMRQNEMKQNP